MKRFLFLLGVLAVVPLIPAVFAVGVPPPSPALSSITYDIYEIGEPIKLTTGPHYERNPSFFKASDGTYWLFFSRSQQEWPNGCDAGGPPGCDGDYYDVYYMTSTDLSSWTEGGPLSTGIGQRDVAAFQALDGTIWVFTASGFGGSIDNQIRYYTYDGTTWTGPTILTQAGTSAGHVDAFQSSDGAIWVVYEQSGPDTYITYTLDNGATWATPVKVNSGGIRGGVPKGMEAKDGTLMVVYTNNGNGIYLATSTDGATWIQSPLPVAMSGFYDYDPVIYQDSDGIYWLFYAPWSTSTNSQWVEFITSTNGKTWSSPIGLTNGGYYDNYWWDFWPEVGEGSDLLVFYTSEQSDGGSYRKDGDIWLIKLEDRINEVKQENENQWSAITNLESLVNNIISDTNNIHTIITNIQNTIEMLKNQLKEIFDYLADIESYLKSGYGVPEPNYCGDGVCDANIGETSSTCPEDCIDGALPSEVFITEGWKVTCPETFDSYNIIGCRAELFKGSWSLANYTMDPLETRKTNWHAGYLLRLYGIPGIS
jgi:hypothetical protein